jgi:hypothetical protein
MTIQKITKLDEVFNYILNMSWFYTFNFVWKVPFMRFHKNMKMQWFFCGKISPFCKNNLEKEYFVTISYFLKKTPKKKKNHNCLQYQKVLKIFYFHILNISKFC